MQRLKQGIERYLSEEQVGFKKDRSATNTLLKDDRRTIQRSGYVSLQLFCRLQKNKAFDFVWHECLSAVFRSYRVNNKLVTILRKIYKEPKTAELVNGETTGLK